MEFTSSTRPALAWLEAVGNIGEVARRLTVHQNTLKYRLRRARDLFGLDLDNPDDRLSCWLQLRIGIGHRSTDGRWSTSAHEPRPDV